LSGLIICPFGRTFFHLPNPSEWLQMAEPRRPRTGLIILAFIAFIALGMPDGLMGVAWPSIRATFSLPLDALGWLLFAAVSGYLTSSFSTGPLIARLGVGKILAISCAVTGAGLVGYTLVPSWWMLVLLGVFAGLGAGAIDSGLNAYAAAHFSEGLMQWLHASYGVGITLGPIIMTSALAAFQSWRLGYDVVGSFQIALSICFVLTLPIWGRGRSSGDSDAPKRLTDYKTPMRDTIRHPAAWVSMLLFFLYTGAEVVLGTWTYTLFTESRGINPELAGLATGSYWGTFTGGRIVAGLFAKRVGVNRLVQLSLIAALLGALLLWWNPASITNLIAVSWCGFAIAPIFPALMSGTSDRVGIHFAANTIGMQMAAGSLGVAIIPSLVGILARHTSLEIIPLCLTVLFTALLIAHRIGSKSEAESESMREA
jgi:fucose permease